MKSLEKFLESHSKTRLLFEIVVPILGDVDMYKKRIDIGMTPKEAVFDISDVLIYKYLCMYGIPLYRILN